MPPSRLPELIAQRGNAAEFPENTLPALRSALELGARHLEFDVQLSADRQPMLLNDSNLKRIAGLDRNALEMTWSELAELRSTNPSGSSNIILTSASLRSPRPSACWLPSRRHRVRRSLKRASLRNFGAEIVMRKISEVLKPVVQQCVIVSRDLPALHHVRQISSYRIGWMLSEYSNPSR